MTEGERRIAALLAQAQIDRDATQPSNASPLAVELTRPVHQFYMNPADYADEPQSAVGKAIDDYRAGKRDDVPAMLGSAAANIGMMPLRMMTLEGMTGLAKDAGRLGQIPYNVLTSPEPVSTAQMVQPAADMAMMAPLGGVALGKATGAKMIEDNAAGIFGGRLAKTADHAKLARAEEMAAKGTPREQIWAETGWFQGPDQKWRFEIDDSGQKLRKTLDELDRSNPMPSDMVFSHDQLHSAYPQVGDIPWYRTPSMEGGGGSYDAARGIRVGSGGGLVSGKSGVGGITLHEQQHAVQGIEGFAKGGNRDIGHPRADVERMAREAYEANRTRPRDADDALLAELGIETPRPTKPWEELTPRQQMEWWEAGRGRAYHHITGEVEARAVQKRMNMSADERAARPPWQDYDVPENQQIVRLYSNSKEGALPGLLSAGESQPTYYRGLTNPDHFGPYPKPNKTPDQQNVFSSSMPQVAGFHGRTVVPVENRFNNPMSVDAAGSVWSNIKHDGGSYTLDRLADKARDMGHDGLHVTNVLDPMPSDVAVALKRGTVYDPKTGDILWSNNEKASPLAAALAGEQRQQPGITAYHGSPHDFDRFSMDKIGIGEGAQAYGHGLYFAENEGVAKQYRDTLSAPVGNDMAQLMLKQHRGDAKAAIADLRSRPGYDISHSMKDAVRRLETGDAATPPGHMYEVRINADPESFLDWDKPLSQQSEKVKQTIEPALRSAAADMGKGAPEKVAQFEAMGLQNIADRMKPKEIDPWSLNVQDMAHQYPNALRDAGIPGIRYLDQGSRGAGEGSRNFVLFRDDIVEIVKKYGWAAAAPMIAQMMMQGQEPDQN